MRLAVIFFSSILLLFASFTAIAAADNIEVRIVSGGNNIFKGTVSTSGCSLTDTNGKVHEISGSRAICALDAASKAGGFSYSVRDTSISLFLESINGVGGDWYYWVNRSFAPVGFEDMTLGSGDSMVLNNGSNTYPEEPKPVEPAPANPEPAPAPEQPKMTETPKTEESKPAEQPQQENTPVQVTQPQLAQTAQPETPKVSETPPQTETPKPSESPKPAPSVEQPKPTPPAQGTANTPVVNPPPTPVPAVETKQTVISPPPLETAKYEPEIALVATVPETTPEIKPASKPSPKNLPNSGPEAIFLLIGPTTFGLGKLLRKKTEHPLARLLKPVKSDKIWYYS